MAGRYRCCWSRGLGIPKIQQLIRDMECPFCSESKGRSGSVTGIPKPITLFSSRAGAVVIER